MAGVNQFRSLVLLSLKPFSVKNQTAELLVTVVKQLIIGASLGNLPIMELYSFGELSHRLLGLIKGFMPLPQRQHSAHAVRSELPSRTTQVSHGPWSRWQGIHGCSVGAPTTCISSDIMLSIRSLMICSRVAPDHAVSGRRMGSRFAGKRFVTSRASDFS